MIKRRAIPWIVLAVALLAGCAGAARQSDNLPPAGTVIPAVSPTATPTAAATAPPAPPAAATGDPTHGEQLFVANCAPCHGLNAGGGSYGPSLVAAYVAAKSDAELQGTILNGRGGVMPTWRGILSEAEIGDVLAFLRARQAE